MCQPQREDPFLRGGLVKNLLLGRVTLFHFYPCSHRHAASDSPMRGQVIPVAAQMPSISHRSPRRDPDKSHDHVKSSQASLGQAQPKWFLNPAAAACLIQETALHV